MMLLKPMVYEIVEHPGIQLARRHYDGEEYWAIFDPVFRAVMNNHGEWEWEPSPSSRGYNFLKRTRFKTPEAALNVLHATSPQKTEELLEKVLSGVLRG